MKLKEDAVPVQSSTHFDLRMNMTLDDIRPLFKDDPKVVPPLAVNGKKDKWRTT